MTMTMQLLVGPESAATVSISFLADSSHASIKEFIQTKLTTSKSRPDEPQKATLTGVELNCSLGFRDLEIFKKLLVGSTSPSSVLYGFNHEACGMVGYGRIGGRWDFW